jgi:hypothetical protein
MWALTGEMYEGPDFRWDGRRYAGILLWEGKGKCDWAEGDRRRAIVSGLLESYTEWANGNCYHYSIVSAECEDTVLDACGGFVGTQALVEALTDVLEDVEWTLVSKDFEFLLAELPSS